MVDVKTRQKQNLRTIKTAYLRTVYVDIIYPIRILIPIHFGQHVIMYFSITFKSIWNRLNDPRY